MKPIIVYWSSNSRGTQRVAEALNTPTIRVEDAGDINQPYILMVPSYDQPKGGFTPKPVRHFLGWHANKMVGVCGTGNRNFVGNFCQAAIDISKRHNVPVVHRIDIMGTQEDYQIIDDGIKQHWATLVDMRGL